MGHDAGRAQPLPVGQALPGTQLRALPERRRICPARPGAAGGGIRRTAHGLGGGSDPTAFAYRLPQGRNSDAALGGYRSCGGRTAVARQQVRSAPPAADAGGGAGVGADSADRRQSLGDHWSGAGRTSPAHRPVLEHAAGTRRAAGRAAARPAAQLRLAGAGARRGAAGYRPAAWPQDGDDDLQICASGTGYREGVSGEGRGQHRQRSPVPQCRRCPIPRTPECCGTS